MSDQPQVCYWRGKRVEDLTREELIEAVKHLGRFFQHETSPEAIRVKVLGHRAALREPPPIPEITVSRPAPGMVFSRLNRMVVIDER